MKTNLMTRVGIGDGPNPGPDPDPEIGNVRGTRGGIGEELVAETTNERGIGI